MPGRIQDSTTTDDWLEAEALAIPYLEAEKGAVAPISFVHFEAAPFLLGAWWPGGDAHVLIYGGMIHPERGVAAMPGFLAYLGPARLRGIDVDRLDGVLSALGASRPIVAHAGPILRWLDHDQDLFPKVVDANGVITYVIHCVEVVPPLPFGLGGGRIITGTWVMQRWTLQLHPVPPHLDWKLEGRVERPAPKLLP